MDTLAVEVRPVTCQYEMYSIQLFRTTQLSFICTLNKNSLKATDLEYCRHYSSVVLKEALLDISVHLFSCHGR